MRSWSATSKTVRSSPREVRQFRQVDVVRVAHDQGMDADGFGGARDQQGQHVAGRPALMGGDQRQDEGRSLGKGDRASGVRHQHGLRRQGDVTTRKGDRTGLGGGLWFGRCGLSRSAPNAARARTGCRSRTRTGDLLGMNQARCCFSILHEITRASRGRRNDRRGTHLPTGRRWRAGWQSPCARDAVASGGKESVRAEVLQFAASCGAGPKTSGRRS